MTRLVFCEICGECLGEDRPNYAKRHLKKYPNHMIFLTKNLIDPLVLKDPDSWFKRRARFSLNWVQTTENLHVEDSTDDFTEPQNVKDIK